jgi:ubiquinone/menaquinone biosynthesis C-methylase UbiE
LGAFLPFDPFRSFAMTSPSDVRVPSAATPVSRPVSHQDQIHDQFSRQAELFAQKSPELHNEAQIALLVDAAAPKSNDVSLDIACGPGTVAVAFARKVQHVTGLDATAAMLDQARALAEKEKLANVDWREGDVYALPFPDRSFDIVSCRYAFHHFERPADAFAEMIRVCRTGGRVVVCDGTASADPAKAGAFNAMERHRDPSTTEFKTLAWLCGLFAEQGLPQPEIKPFHVVYERDQMVAKSFPVGDDRALLVKMIDDLIATDAMEVGSKPGGTVFTYPAVVLTVTKP